jgi:hypothetical protein
MNTSGLAIKPHHFGWYGLRAQSVKGMLINLLILVDKMRHESV